MSSTTPPSDTTPRRPGVADPGGALDLIGDVHGHADTLHRLLEVLGYRWADGVPSHPDRTAVFLGDYIDRGPGILETLRTVRGMVEHGHAVALMGNHEYNAIAWFTPRPDRPEIPCRRHTPIRRKLIEPTLRAIGHDLEDWLDWMRRLPMWMESARLRAVHACWNENAARHLQTLLEPSAGVLTEGPMQATCEPGTPSFRAIEQLLKGEEVPLPAEFSMTDPEGSPRHHIRARWFESPHGRSYREYAMTRDDRFPSVEIPREAIPPDFVPYGRDERPIFVGHYWMRGDVPRRLAPNVACLDWSVARDGPLVAYRFDGESEIDDDRFVAVS